MGLWDEIKEYVQFIHSYQLSHFKFLAHAPLSMTDQTWVPPSMLSPPLHYYNDTILPNSPNGGPTATIIGSNSFAAIDAFTKAGYSFHSI